MMYDYLVPFRRLMNMVMIDNKNRKTKLKFPATKK